MKNEIVLYSMIGLLSSAAWVAIIWAIGKYSPSPWWGLLCLPLLAAAPFVNWLCDRVEKYENQPEESY